MSDSDILEMALAGLIAVILVSAGLGAMVMYWSLTNSIHDTERAFQQLNSTAWYVINANYSATELISSDSNYDSLAAWNIARYDFNITDRNGNFHNATVFYSGQWYTAKITIDGELIQRGY